MHHSMGVQQGYQHKAKGLASMASMVHVASMAIMVHVRSIKHVV